MALVLTTPGRNYYGDGFVDQLNGGKLKVKDSSGTLLLTFTLGSPAFGNTGASVAGRSDGNAIANAVAIATGIATQATLHKSDDTQLATFSVATSGSDMNIDDTSIVATGVYACPTFNITTPAS